MSLTPEEERLAEIEHEAPHVASREAMVLIRELVALVRGLRARVEALEEALTPSGATKAAFIGEFRFADENGFTVAVPWTTTKAIMAAISARAALQSTGEGRDSARNWCPPGCKMDHPPRRAAPTEAPRKYQVNCRERHCDFGPVTLTKMPDVTERNCPRCGEPLDIMSAALTGKEGER